MPSCRVCGRNYEPWAALVYGHRINSLCCIDCFGAEEELMGFGFMYVFYGDQDPEGVRGKLWKTGDPWPKPKGGEQPLYSAKKGGESVNA